MLPEMMRYMDAGADVVYGQRMVREGETRSKRFGAFLFYRLLASMSDVPIPIDTGDFRLMGRNVLDVLLAMPEQNRFIRGMVSWAGFRQVAIPYERAAREKGVTKYTPWKMLDFALDAITGFSAFPLRLSIAFSLIFFLASGSGAHLCAVFVFLPQSGQRLDQHHHADHPVLGRAVVLHGHYRGIRRSYFHRDKTAAALRHPGSEVLAGRVGRGRYGRIGRVALRPVIAGQEGAALCPCGAARRACCRSVLSFSLIFQRLDGSPCRGPKARSRSGRRAPGWLIKWKGTGCTKSG